ncbi:polymerase/histidinol phosphatase-like [Rhynchospora pubera]|uniref:Polymerase/histidinol phosphatase-like n=1 Tax=Rhynchospora pubera TaxID=906938 RepID=A0AAV8FAG7_9POAL|nr:polymerase/histidinol phosphatase-like [Rhynchospora pubera]
MIPLQQQEDATDAPPPPLQQQEDATQKKNKKKKKKKKRRRRKIVTPEEISAATYVRHWVFPDSPPDDAHILELSTSKPAGRILFELHSHSTCSDGFLSPTALVHRAHARGVKVLALTDHDTMAGITEAIEAAHKLGIKIIPGVEISASVFSKEEAKMDEPVHILAYYGSWGPTKYNELEEMLTCIREGRHFRAKKILSKLTQLKMPLKFEQVSRIAGTGVAPGRVHVARAMVEAGYVENIRQAFSKYLYDGGPAYASGNEPRAEKVIRLICRTGGVAVLAHPWALKNPPAVVKSLKASGLHAIEVYRSDGKLSGLSDIADSYGLVKVGGSDFHGRSGCEEPDLGSVHLPVISIFEFLKLAHPIWCEALKDILTSGADGERKFPFCNWISDRPCHDCCEIQILGKNLSCVTIGSG